MRYMLVVLVGAIGIGLIGGKAVKADDMMEVKGVLIDQHCAAKFMDKDDPQAAAEKGHDKACCEKCAKDGAGLAVISGKKMYKLDDAGKEKAMKYLKRHDNMNVIIAGDEKDGTIAVKTVKEDKEKAANKEEKKEG